MSQSISVAYGNGIGPEIMESVIQIMKAAQVPLTWEVVEIGESIYKKGIKTGIEDSTWKSLDRTKVFLKAPITTPQGGGFRSLNVTIRKKLGLYANIRPCVAYHPFVSTKHPGMNIVVIRENEEDLYTGMEYRQTQEMVQCLKIISRSGSRRISQFAFEYALQNNRKKVTCFTKDNIMKQTDGLFRKIFEEVGKNYPKCEKEHWIIDIGAAKMACYPETFDVLVLPNLYGDILSDVAAQMSGSVGMVGSANIGDEYAMFEAIHGSAPRRAGQNLANPSGLLQAAILMLNHIGQNQFAELIQNSWLTTLENGIHTYDIYQKGISKTRVGTKEFTQAIIKNLGQTPQTLQSVSYQPFNKQKYQVSKLNSQTEKKTLTGVDIFIDDAHISISALAKKTQSLSKKLKLHSISSRGINVWPDPSQHALLSDHWRLRFMNSTSHLPISHTDIIQLLFAMESQGIDFNQTQNLYSFNGQPGFSINKAT